MQNLEGFEVLKFLRLDFHFLYLRMFRPFLAEFHHFIDILRISLKKNFYSSVLEISCEALYIISFCIFLYKSPEKNTLHSSCNINPDCFFHILDRQKEFLFFIDVFKITYSFPPALIKMFINANKNFKIRLGDYSKNILNNYFFS